MQILIRILVQICSKLRLNAMSIRTLVQICTKLRLTLESTIKDY